VERSINDEGKLRAEEKMQREEEEWRAVRAASEKGSREYRGLEERELNRLEMEKMGRSEGLGSKTSKSGEDGQSDNEMQNNSWNNDSRMVEGALVFIKDAHYSWIPATIESPEE
jgi:hypothetical protein